MREGSLTRDGEPIPLTPKEFMLLSLLVRRAGQLVSKDEILAEVWPQTVVEESNLAVHISALRRILGESAASPTYIETIPRRGYRFIAAVQDVPPVVESIPVAPSAPAPSKPSGFRWPQAAAAVLAILAVSWWFEFRERPIVWNPLPLTSEPGVEITPSLSPDGKQVLYAISTPSAQRGLILNTLSAEGAPVRLTSGPDFHPTWSPNGREIAFVRFHADPNPYAELVVRLSFGGADRAIRRLDYLGAPPGPTVRYTPDGRWILTTLGTGNLAGLPPRRIVAISPETGETQPILEPPKGYAGDFAPVMSPRGDRLVFSRCGSPQACDLYDVAMRGLTPQGAPRRITFLPSPEIHSLFLPSGALVYSIGPQEARSLWVMVFDWFGRPHPRQVSANGEDASQPTAVMLSDGTIRLAYVRSMVDVNIWKLSLDAPDGRGVAAVPAIASTRMEETPAYSPDGQRVAFASTRSGMWEIWTCSPVGDKCAQVTHLGPAYSRSPVWSPDGKMLLFDSRPSGNSQLFVVNANGGTPRQISFGETATSDPCWSPDGKWIYFASSRTGRPELYRSPAPSLSKGDVTYEQLTTEGGASPRLSPDGETILYRGAKGEFFRFAIRERKAYPLPVTLPAVSAPYPATGSIAYAYMIDLKARQGFVARTDWSTGAIEFLHPTTLDRPLGISRSPDARSLLFLKTDRNESDLMVVDGLRF